MNINIDYKSRICIYEQIVLEVERLITLDILKPDDKIPSIRELACSLNINPNTVKKAYDILEEKNLIISKSTKGTFINNAPLDSKSEKINTLLTDIQKNIRELESLGLDKKEILKRLAD